MIMIDVILIQYHCASKVDYGSIILSEPLYMYFYYSKYMVVVIYAADERQVGVGTWNIMWLVLKLGHRESLFLGSPPPLYACSVP